MGIEVWLGDGLISEPADITRWRCHRIAWAAMDSSRAWRPAATDGAGGESGRGQARAWRSCTLSTWLRDEARGGRVLALGWAAWAQREAREEGDGAALAGSRGAKEKKVSRLERAGKDGPVGSAEKKEPREQ